MSLNRFNFALIIFSIIIVYSNTLHYPWHLDDPPNIVKNPTIQITELSFPDSLGWLAAKPYTEKLSRPVSYLTFSINWYFGQKNTFGYHIVNILVHILTALSLYTCIGLLLASEIFNKSKKLTPTAIVSISLVATLLWALHPIQIQAVTYIVQRMTSLAALFAIISIYFFIRNHGYSAAGQRVRSLIFCAFSYILAILSKENAVILPFSLLLIHHVFYANDSRPFSRYLRSLLLAASGAIVLAAVYYIASSDILGHLFANTQYHSRPYTLLERLLTQSRIVVFYISQLLYPLPTRFSIDHTFVLSESLFSPWTTLPAIAILVILALFSLLKRRSFPLLSFAILFFLTNHLVESTIIPLELVFEHRNYLPSLFFFLPIAYLIVTLIFRYRTEMKALGAFITAATMMVISLVGWSTYYRNLAWSSEEQLWLDAVKKAPQNARPYAYLGQIYGFTRPRTQENLEKSVFYYTQAFGKIGPVTGFNGAILQNIAKAYFNYGNNEQALEYYLKSIEANTPYQNAYLELAQTYIVMEEFEQAIALLEEKVQDPDFVFASQAYNLIGFNHLWLGQYDQAVDAIGKSLRSTPDKIKVFYNMGAALSKAGHYKQAEWFLKHVMKATPDSIPIMLSVIENTVRWGKIDIAEKLAANMIEVFTEAKVNVFLDPERRGKLTSVPLDLPLITPVIRNALTPPS